MADLLALALMLKDEADSVRPLLESVRGIADYVLVLDTGSTDGTPDLALAAMYDFGLKGRVEREPFVDFSTTRNRALELAEPHGRWVLMLSGDEKLTHADGLRAFLETAPDDAYLLRVDFVNLDYASARLHRSGSGWRYKGRTHEVLVSPKDGGAPHHAAPARVFHDRSRLTRDKCIPRWQKDVELLSQTLAENPGDARACFYLAQTYEMLHEWEKAIALYRRRLELSGYDEELFASWLRMARIMKNTPHLHTWAEVQDAYLQAHALRPHRPEPLVDLGDHYIQLGQQGAAHTFFLRAARLPYPEQDRLCVEPTAYSWAQVRLAQTAWHAGDFTEGEAAITRALKRQPLDPVLLRMRTHYTGHRVPPPPKPGVIKLDDVLWLVPSRRRPQSLRRLAEALHTSETASAGLVIVDDADWNDNNPYYRALENAFPDGWGFHVTRGESMGDKLRETWDLYKDRGGIGLFGDDNVPVTKRWDALMAECLDGSNVLSSDDDWRACHDIYLSKMAGATLWSGGLVREVGYLFPPGLHHFIDDAWEAIGRAVGCWQVRMDVLVTHDHVFKTGAEQDETTRKAYARSEQEHQVLDAWKQGDFRRAVADVMRMRMGREPERRAA